MNDGRGPAACGAGEGLGGDGNLPDGQEVSGLKAIALPCKVVRHDEEERKWANHEAVKDRVAKASGR